jgi:hypothetical protein
LSQIERYVNTGTWTGTNRDNCRPRSPRRQDEEAAELTGRSGDGHPLIR